MFQRRIPESLRHASTPGVKGFALLAAVESSARGILISVFPIVMYRAFGDAQTVSEIYLLVGVLSLAAALSSPWISRFIARRWLFTLAAIAMMCGGVCAAQGGTWSVPIGLAVMTVATVIITVCFNAYVMDYIARSALGECETLRLFYSGAAWTIGPFLGVWLMDWWLPAPFIVSALASILLLVIFWVLRLGNGKLITKARIEPPNPLAFLPRFLKQPRLIAGWSFAVVRSCGWWVYVVYLPIYAIESGFSEQLGGVLLSISNSFLFFTPLMLKWMRGRVRYAVRIGFLGSSLFFLTAAAFALVNAYLVIGFLVLASLFLVLLDISAGLPFLMAVKPSERTDMSAVYSTFRDVSGVVAPAVARTALLVAPLPAVFAITACGLFISALVATRLHPRLGNRRTAVLGSTRNVMHVTGEAYIPVVATQTQTFRT